VVLIEGAWFVAMWLPAAGLIPEFVGRFANLVSTHGLTLDQMVRVLTQPKNAIIKQYKYLFAMHNVDFHITDEALEEVASIAIKKNTVSGGVRRRRGL